MEDTKNIIQLWITNNRLDQANDGITNAQYLELVELLTAQQ